MKWAHDKSLSRETAISLFDQEILKQEDIVYGVALFFECLSLIHANQPTVVETYRKQFRNIIQKGRERIAQAAQLREQIQQAAARPQALSAFRFIPCQGHAQPESMAQRAEALVATYNQIFPGRPRSKEFTPEEALLLLEKASNILQP
ncbi:MAG: hypothetical protein ACNA71_00875 [Kiritimatiellia bacterium]